jgi:hypothetical protein
MPTPENVESGLTRGWPVGVGARMAWAVALRCAVREFSTTLFVVLPNCDSRSIVFMTAFVDSSPKTVARRAVPVAFAFDDVFAANKIVRAGVKGSRRVGADRCFVRPLGDAGACCCKRANCAGEGCTHSAQAGRKEAARRDTRFSGSDRGRVRPRQFADFFRQDATHHSVAMEEQSSGEFASAHSASGAQDAALQKRRLSAIASLDLCRRLQHLQRPTPSHISQTRRTLRMAAMDTWLLATAS